MNIAECKEYEKNLGVRPVKEFLDYYLKLSLFLAGAFPEKFGHIIKYPLKITTKKLSYGRVFIREHYQVCLKDHLDENLEEINKDISELSKYFMLLYKKPAEVLGTSVKHIPETFLGKPYDYFKGKPPLLDRLIMYFFKTKGGCDESKRLD
jgi:hypothetical protein